MMPKNRHAVYRLLLTALALCLAIGETRSAQSTLPAEPQRTVQRIDEIFTEWAAPGGPGCAVSVSRDDTLVFSKGYGSANLEYDIPITPATVFHVASISKQFTALAVQLLVNDGRVSWEDDIAVHVQEMASLGIPITLRQLAHHISGLRDQWSLLRLAGWRFEGDVVTQSDVLNLLGSQRDLNFEPGTRYLYSNSGYTLLAAVVERTTGQSIREFADERIFAPLGMTRTHFHDDHRMLVKDRAYAYAAADEGGYRLSIPAFSLAGATNLFTTVGDLARWQRNFHTFEIGGDTGIYQLQTVGRLTDGRLTTYAFGLAHGVHRGFHTISHGGTDAGYRSEILRFPDQRVAVAVLCNGRAADPYSLARETADLYLPLPASTASVASSSGTLQHAAAATAGTRSDVAPGDTAAFAALAGYYRREETDVPLNFVARNGALTTVGSRNPLTLTPHGESGFRVAGSAGSIETAEFIVAEQMTRLHLRAAGGAPDVYERAEPWRPTIDELPPFVGYYESRELGIVYTFHIENGHLALWHRKFGSVKLTPTYDRGFYGDGLYVQFDPAVEGTVAGFTASTPRAWKVRFERRAN